METSIPVAVKFLNKGNKELSRNLASYLSLIAIEHSYLLSPYVYLILDSILTDNFGLSRILLSLYEINPEPIIKKCSDLVEIIPKCEVQEQLTLLQLLANVAKTKPSALHGSLQQLCDLLPNAALTHSALSVLLRLSEQRPLLILEYTDLIKASASISPQCLNIVAQILSSIGKLGKEHAQNALDFVLELLPTADRSAHSTLLQEARKLCTQYPVLFTEKVTAVIRQRNILIQQQNNANKTSGSVTIVKLNSPPAPGGLPKPSIVSTPQSPPALSTTVINTSNHTSNAIQTVTSPVPMSNGTAVAAVATTTHTGYTRRAKLGDSRSTGRLHGGNTRSMTRLNIGSVGGLHKSMTRLSSSQQINQQNGSTPNTNSHNQINGNSQSMINSGPPPLSSNVIITGENKYGIPILKSGNVTVTTSPTKAQRPYSTGPLGSSTVLGMIRLKDDTDTSSNALNQSSGSISMMNAVTTVPVLPLSSDNQVSVSGPSTEITRRFETKTLLNAQVRIFFFYILEDSL